MPVDFPGPNRTVWLHLVFKVASGDKKTGRCFRRTASGKRSVGRVQGSGSIPHRAAQAVRREQRLTFAAEGSAGKNRKTACYLRRRMLQSNQRKKAENAGRRNRYEMGNLGDRNDRKKVCVHGGADESRRRTGRRGGVPADGKRPGFRRSVWHSPLLRFLRGTCCRSGGGGGLRCHPQYAALRKLQTLPGTWKARSVREAVHHQ